MSAAIAFAACAGAVLATAAALRVGRSLSDQRRSRARVGLATWRRNATPGDRVRAGVAARRARLLWPAWLEAAARSARSGAPVRTALLEACVAFGDSPLAPRLEGLRGALHDGVALDGALAELPPGNEAVVRALRLASVTGGSAASVLDAVAATMHERAASAREVAALSSPARASAAVLVLAPLVFTVLSGGVDPRVIDFFASSPGLACLVGGGALDVLGALWMARIVRRAS